jgi:hypothetical protein
MQVLRAFDFSTDGFTSQHLEPGDDPSGVPGEFVAGLTAEGFLGDGEAATKALAGAPETGEAVALETAENEPQPEAAPEGEPASEECAARKARARTAARPRPAASPRAE